MVKRIRPIRIDGDVAYIPLSGKPDAPHAIIDADDVELVDGVNWSEGAKLSGKRAERRAADLGWTRLRGYPMRALPSRKLLLLNRYLVGALPSDRVVFRDNDPYNCRRSNLLIDDRELLPDGVSRDGARYRVDDRLPDGGFGLLGVFDTVPEAKAALEEARRARQRAKRQPDYVLGAKPDPAKLAETQERLAKRRAAVQATE